VSTHFEALSVSRAPDGVCEVTLARPELLNRFDNLLQIELAAALAQIGADDTVRVVVLASTGKAFSAGGDFALMQAAHDDAEVRAATVDAGYNLVQAFLARPQPIVVAVHGAAIGLGATVALLCDVVVAA
jgi:enoyl-CoA hydratase